MTSWHWQQLRFAMGLGSFMSFYGIVGLIVWFGGSYLGVSLGPRIVVIALILLTLPLALVASAVRKRSKEKKEQADSSAAPAAKVESGGDVAAKDGAPKKVAESGDMKKGAEEVVKFLKSSDLGTSANAVYSLPWYIVAGARGAGKSALVLASGLNFQTLPSQRQSELKFIRPTRQVDWRVTSDAVFIDTAGRFQDEDNDHEDWSALLETVKKQRPNRPLDGLILSVNTEKILNSDEREIEEMAKILRSRLDDATKRLKTKFPVYLVFTNADSIEGFRDSFSTSKKEGDELVWGTTIPLEKSENAQSLFDSEFEILQDSLMQRRLIRLSAPFAPVRQLRIFNFPLHFSSARRKLGSFVSTLFRPNPFSESPFLRGFYFTAVPANRQKSRGSKPAAPPTVGASYFTKKLFSDVILRDKDLVRTFSEQRQKPPILGWILTILGTILTIAVLGFSAFSLFYNKAFLDDAVAKGSVVVLTAKTDINIDPLAKKAEQAQKEINELNDLRKILVQMDEYERNGPPLYMRWGLYSGNRLLKERLLNIYYNAVERRFRKPTITRLERELNSFASGAPASSAVADSASDAAQNAQDKEEEELDRHYDLLEAYLLLSEEHKDRAKDASAASKVAETLEPFWVEESKLPPGNETLAKEQLAFYFKQIDREDSYSGDTSGFPRISPNDGLVDRVRKRLVKYPAYKRYLKRETAKVSAEVPEASVESLLGGNSRGYLEGTHKIPGAYTIAGYRGHMKAKIDGASAALSEDDWVMGEEGSTAEIKTEEIGKLKTDYFNRYAAHWQRLLDEAKIRTYASDEEVVDALETFSGPESPMKILFQEVARNTNFAAKPPVKAWYDLTWIFDLFGSSGEGSEVESNTEVEKQFSAVILFLGDPESDQPQPIDLYAQDLSTVASPLKSASAATMLKYKQQLANQEDSPRSFHKIMSAVEDRIDSKLKSFQSSAAIEAANLLRMPLENVRVRFGADSTTQIEKQWKDSILQEAKGIETGYPFVSQSSPVTDLKAVSKYLNPQNGTLTTFYNSRLKIFFDGEPGNELTVKADSRVRFSPEFVAYLNNAFKLQKTLFGGNAAPNFQYDFIIIKEGDVIIDGTIDGTPVSSRETGSFKLTFPAQSGINGVSLNILSSSSTSSTGSPFPPPPGSGTGSGSDANLNFPGEWGLFNFFDAASSKTETEGGYLLTYNRGGKSVKIRIRTIGGDPFDRSTFTSVRAPDDVLQRGTSQN